MPQHALRKDVEKSVSGFSLVFVGFTIGSATAGWFARW